MIGTVWRIDLHCWLSPPPKSEEGTSIDIDTSAPPAWHRSSPIANQCFRLISLLWRPAGPALFLDFATRSGNCTSIYEFLRLGRRLYQSTNSCRLRKSHQTVYLPIKAAFLLLKIEDPGSPRPLYVRPAFLGGDARLCVIAAKLNFLSRKRWGGKTA